MFSFKNYGVMRLMLIPGLALCAFASGPAKTPDPAETPVLSLDRAIELAVKHHPQLAAALMDVEIAREEAGQAGLRLNPELELETESFGGSGPYDGFSEAESTLTLGQTFQIGGKRAREKALASLDRDLADWDYQLLKLELVGQVRKRFLAVLAAQEQVRITGELTRLAQEVYTVVSQKVEAGKVAPLEQTRAKVALAEARLEQKQAANQLMTSRLRLAGAWGAVVPDFQRLEGDLLPADGLPDPQDFSVEAHPALAREDGNVSKAKAGLQLEQARRIPDLDLKAGWKRFEDSGDGAFTLGVGVALPVFNRNKGAVAAAGIRISQAREDRRATQLSLELMLQEAYASLKTAYEEATLLSDELLPASEWAFNAAREGYRLGKFAYLDVADAQRSLFQIQRMHIKALAAYHGAVIDMEQLTGRGPGNGGGL